MELAKRPNAIVLDGERKKCGKLNFKINGEEKGGKVNSHLDIN